MEKEKMSIGMYVFKYGYTKDLKLLSEKVYF